MRIGVIRTLTACVLLGFVSSAGSHGLIESPPSRNWFCGAITKPDQVANGTAQYPVCGNAFTAPGIDFTAGYSFMSVLTHTTGRAGVGPRENVCGFNSETWNGAATVWDQPIDWPTNTLTPGLRTFTWNISWGPHFSDTEEFRYWITRPGFQFQVGRPLSFADFEDLPFCSLTYSDANPTGNPNVIANPAAATFQTRCTVPQRSGRHVIYGEWGRNFFTFERFHSCIDAVFQGSSPTVDAQIALNPNITEFQGSGSITLDGRGSTGSNLGYQWSVDSQNPGLYSISNPTQPLATLNLTAPQAAGNVTISLVVTSGTASDSATRSLTHLPATASPWFDLGPLTAEPRTLAVGDRVSVRTVSSTGQDAFWPASPLVITAATAAANAWPLALAQAINAATGAVRVGVLNAQNQVVPAQNATSNRVFAMTSASLVSAFLQVVPDEAPTDGVTVTRAITANGQWFNEQQVRIANTSAITALSISVVIQRTTGISHSGQYNTVGGQIQQSNSSTASAITYQFTLAPGQTLNPAASRTFAVQTSGTGTVHPTTGDTYTVTYTTGGVSRTQSGTF